MISALIVAVYLVMAGAVYSLVLAYLDDSMLAPLAALAALAWPATIPVSLGMYVVRTPERIRRTSAARARQQMEAARAAKRRTVEMEKECEIKPLPNLPDPFQPPRMRPGLECYGGTVIGNPLGDEYTYG